MQREREYFVYILTNWKHSVLYTGVTNDIFRRLEQHKAKAGSVFTRRYNAIKLVYVERFQYVEDAIAREKQIKGGSRAKKIALIDGINSEWNDLSGELFD
jgi:putative endonuclease